jgi:1-deoxy-D-xylulose-5-phosphate synthase
VVFAIDRGGIVGDDGKTHQGAFDLSYLSLIPNLIVASPKDENELQHLLFTASKVGKPMAVRYPRSTGVGVQLDGELHLIPVGKGEILRHGVDIGIIAIGATVMPALEAAYQLENKGIQATVVNARFAKPLDAELILDVASQTKRLVTVEENTLQGGFGSYVTNLVKQAGLNDIQIKSLGLPDKFIEHGAQSLLRARYGLDVNGITKEALAFFPVYDTAKVTRL